MIELDEVFLGAQLAGQRARVKALGRGGKLSREERSALEFFWNPFLHKRRDEVPLIAILDHELQKITIDPHNQTAVALARARIEALMKVGLVGEELLDWSSCAVPSTAKFWLTNEGAAYFASSYPAALRNPLLFARRHLSLLQLVGVAVSIVLAIATFAGRLLGWVG